MTKASTGTRKTDPEAADSGKAGADRTGTKNVLLRLDPGLAERVQAIAEVEGRTVSDVIREAIAALVEQRRHDRSFAALLEESLAGHRRTLDLLREDDR